MNYDPWNVNVRHSRFSKFLPALLKDKSFNIVVLLLVAVCIDWQLSVRMDDLQYYLMFLYLTAHVEMFVGFNELVEIIASLPDGNVDVTRIGITTHHYFVGAWSRYCDAIMRGIGIAFFFTALSVTFSVANKSIEKRARKQRQALDEIDSKAALAKEQKRYRLERPKPPPPPPVKPAKTGVDNKFELPEVEPLSDLIDEPEDDVSAPTPLPEKTAVAEPLRLPGRIYRDEN